MEQIWVTLIESAFTFAGILAGTFLAGKGIRKKLDRLAAHDREQYLTILKLTVMNSEMPLSERIIAGSKYVAAGGNGEVKQYYQKMLSEHTK